MGKNTDILESRILMDVMQILHKYDIPFWLDSGTLLGLIRDQKDIPWHKHINLSVPGQYFDQFMDLKRVFLPKYRLFKIIDRSGRCWIDNDYPRVKIFKSYKRHRDPGLKINITFKYKKDKHYVWVDKRSCKRVSAYYLDELTNVTLHGRTFPIPNDVEAYLQCRYGNWKKVNNEWISGIHDQSILDKETVELIPTKKRIRKSKGKSRKIKLKGKYRDRMKRMICRIIDILEKNDIPYWFDEGTLLGVIRDGDLLPWDHDADLGIPGSYAEKLWAIRRQFYPWFYVKKVKTSNKWLPGRVRSFKIKTRFERLLRINFHVDLFCKYQVNDMYRSIILNALRHVDAKYYDQLDKVTWEGRDVSIPSFAEEYLTLNYGPWRVPDPDFDPSVSNGAIAERGF